MIITIDGPAGAGKSTVSRALAARLGYRYLDTGAMYRAVALVALETGDDPVQVAQSAGWTTRLLDPALRSDAVDAAVSGVSCLPEVREALRGAQRDFLAQGDAVGADGTTYFTDANTVRAVTRAGAVTTVAGGFSSGSSNGVGTRASFSSPNGVAVGFTGTLYVSGEAPRGSAPAQRVR